jgi:hypothetical protein
MSFKVFLKVTMVPVIVIGLLVLTRNALAAPSLIISKTVNVTTAAPAIALLMLSIFDAPVLSKIVLMLQLPIMYHLFSISLVLARQLAL